MGPVGECQALCFRTLDELTMDPPGNLGSAPSVIDIGGDKDRMNKMTHYRGESVG